MHPKTCYLCREPISKERNNHARYCEDYCKDLNYRLVRGLLSYPKAMKLLGKRRKHD